MSNSNQDYVVCATCRRDVPKQNYEVHSVHCVRNSRACSVCKEIVPKSLYQEHKENEHATKPRIPQPESPKKEKEEIKKTKAPPSRLVICKYCFLDQDPDCLEEHEGYCGSRTEFCEECHDYVKLKDWDAHQQMTLFHELCKKPCKDIFDSSEYKSSSASASSLNLPAYLRSNSGGSAASIVPNKSFDCLTKSGLNDSKPIASSRYDSYALKRTETDSFIPRMTRKTRNNEIDETTNTRRLGLERKYSWHPKTDYEDSSGKQSKPKVERRTSKKDSSSIVSKYLNKDDGQKTMFAFENTGAKPKPMRRSATISTANEASTDILIPGLPAPPTPCNNNTSKEEESRKSSKRPERDQSKSRSIVSECLKPPPNRNRLNNANSFKKSKSTAHVPDYSARQESFSPRDVDAVREMLGKLRKDPFDDDLENNDGTFFPCEFCGDPYPCEFLMRHQIICDLNPFPSGIVPNTDSIRNSIESTLGSSHFRKEQQATHLNSFASAPTFDNYLK